MPGTLDLSTLNGLNGYNLAGITASDYSGNFMSGVGDVNADGIDDFIIGAPNASPNNKVQAGAIYVIFGKMEREKVRVLISNSNNNQYCF